jgi:glucose-1-phosphate adenylyltransferase
MPGVEIGRYSRIRRAIIDRGVKVPESVVIGYNPEEDRARGFTVTDSGIVVVPRGIFQTAEEQEPAVARRGK